MRLTERHLSFLAGTLLLFALLVVTVSPTTERLLQRLDFLFYDLLLPLQSPGISDDITVIAIDNRSISELGRWPWSRAVHAGLLEKLFDMRATVIGFDVLFSEPQVDDPGADRQLAQALGRGPVVLPVAPSRQSETSLISEMLPIPAFASSAAALGHVDVELDRDGLARSTFLYGGVGEARWASFALAMLQAAGSPVAGDYPPPEERGFSAGWRRAAQRLVPFTRPGDGPRMMSASDVLAGRVSADAIAGKYVLIGATATGLGDALSTPGALSHERMPGVVLNAQILNGLLQGDMITPLSAAEKRLRSLILVVLVMLAILTSPARINVLIAALGAALVLAASAVMLARGGRWFAPATSLIPILLVWPLWTAWQYQRAKQLSERLARQLEHQASYHLVTDLPNHQMLEDRLRTLRDDRGRTGVAALMVIHINWPGSATVVLDRPISDAVLRAIKERLASVARPGDFVAHLGNEDFAMLAEGFTDADEAQRAAANLLEEMQKPLKCAEEHLLLAPEIGVSLCQAATGDPRELLRNAYTAMFKSRLDDTKHLCIYSAEVSGDLETRSQLEQALIFALERREFTIFYQPQISVRNSRIVGVEALLRWNNPTLGWVEPAAFIPVAEHVGLIRSIGAWVIEEACRQLQAWNRAGYHKLRMGINVSPLQFMAPGLADDIEEIVLRLGIEPGSLELEITESSLMHDVGDAVRVMRRIKEFGLELAIDDFGTGYSSLSNLRQFPIDRLKIDQGFVQDIGKSGHAERITVTVIAMSRHMGLRVIAEGVETEAQAEFLRENGCDEFQGFLFGKPMPAGELTELLARQYKA